MVGCSWDEAEEVIEQGQENSSESIPTAIGGVVATATGIPIAAPIISFLVGLGMAIVERKKRKKTEVVAGVMARAIEGSTDKVAIAGKVHFNTLAAGVATEALNIVKENT